jgi:valyl-tRNA synthetase
VTEHLENFNFSLAAEELNDFTWNKLADWYLEIAKIEKDKEEILLYVLKNILILWHPFIPFVTEEIWSSFNDSLLMVAKWPQAESGGKIVTDLIAADQEFKKIQDLVIAIRNARSENKIEPAQKIEAVVYGHNDWKLIQEQQEIIKALKTGLQSLEIKETGGKIAKAIAVVNGGIEVYLLGGIDEQKERGRLLKEKENLEKMIGLQETKLGNADFVGRAPASIVVAEKDKLAAYQLELEKIIKIIQAL